MQLFSADGTIFLIFFAHENMKKTPSKVAHNRPQMVQKQKSRTTKSPLMQDWVFRLGSKQITISNQSLEQRRHR